MRLRATCVALAAICLSSIDLRAAEVPMHSAFVEATHTFLATLDDAQRTQATFEFSDEERFNWHFFPRERKGIALADLNDTQLNAAKDLLKAALSAQGFEQSETIRALEDILREMENNESRKTLAYHLSVFGEPAAEGTWGLRYEGHHLSLNWTFVAGQPVAFAPQFLGANPANVPSGPKKGTRALGVEEDWAREFVNSLDDAQRKKAIIGDIAPRDIFTAAQREVTPLEDAGIAYSELKEDQGMLLRALILRIAGVQRPEVADARLSAIDATGMDKVKFAWMGSLEPGQGHYYRIQGPTFLIEYDNTQNNANHVHLVWRDFDGDFGRDLLREHYADDHPAAKRP